MTPDKPTDEQIEAAKELKSIAWGEEDSAPMYRMAQYLASRDRRLESRLAEARKALVVAVKYLHMVSDRVESDDDTYDVCMAVQRIAERGIRALTALDALPPEAK